MVKNSVYDLLRADGSIVINKRLAKAIGLNETILYSELLSRHYYFAERAALDNGGYFFNTIEDLQDGTTLTQRQQTPALKNLVKLGLIDMKVAGVPAKRYFRIVEAPQVLFDLLDKQKESTDVIKARAAKLVYAFKRAGATNEVTPELIAEVERTLRNGQHSGSKWKQA